MTSSNKAEYVRETDRVARHLGLPAYGPGADAAIVDYCSQQVWRLIGKHGLPRTMGELLGKVATCLEVEFFEVYSDDDLHKLMDQVPPEREPAIVRVLQELDDDELDAVTIRRTSRQPWEMRYLAVINCRGKHFARRYFTKWHELTHRLIEGEQLMLAFRQTPVERPDPGEVLVDKIAGELAFLPDVVGPHAERCLRQPGLTFGAVDALREAVAPEASRHSTALALMQHADQPAWYLRCAVSLKKSEMREASNLRPAAAVPEPKLRVLEASANQAARDAGIWVYPWMRVPETGIVAQAMNSEQDLAGHERLEEWETSNGGPLGIGELFIDAQISGDQVLALVTLTDTEVLYP